MKLTHNQREAIELAAWLTACGLLAGLFVFAIDWLSR